MAGLDDLFEKSTLAESKKKSKMIFGKLLIALRKSGAIKLYSLLGGVSETDISNNKLMMYFKEQATFDMVNTSHDIENINGILSSIEGDLKVEMICLEKNHLDEYKFEEFLKEEFGKILTIK